MRTSVEPASLAMLVSAACIVLSVAMKISAMSDSPATANGSFSPLVFIADPFFLFEFLREVRIGYGERMAAMNEIDISDSEHAAQLIGRHFHRTRAFGCPGMRLRECS